MKEYRDVRLLWRKIAMMLGASLWLFIPGCFAAVDLDDNSQFHDSIAVSRPQTNQASVGQIVNWHDDVILATSPGLVDGPIAFGSLKGKAKPEFQQILQPLGNIRALAQRPDGCVWVLIRKGQNSELVLVPASSEPIQSLSLPQLEPTEKLLYLIASSQGPILLGEKHISYFFNEKWQIVDWQSPTGLGADIQAPFVFAVPFGQQLFLAYRNTEHNVAIDTLESIDLNSGQRTAVFGPTEDFQPSEPSSWDVRGLGISEETVWVGSWSRGLLRLEGTKFLPVFDLQSFSDSIETMTIDSLGVIWIGGRRGVYRYTKGKLRKEFDLPKNLLPYAIKVIGNDRLILGGLIKLGSPTSGQFVIATFKMGQWSMQSVTTNSQ